MASVLPRSRVRPNTSGPISGTGGGIGGIPGDVGGVIGGAASGVGGAIGSAAGDVGSTAAGAASGVGGVIDGVASAIGSVLDFLKLIGWLFHPKNWLRMVEFLVGLILMGLGLWVAIQARGERMEGFTTSESAISRSGLGRVSRALARRERPRSAPHRSRREALRLRYEREERLRSRR